MPELTEEQIQKGWDHIRRSLPDNHPALKQLDRSVYGVSGLTDVAEWYLWEVLEQSGLTWELVVNKVNYLGSENRPVRNQSYFQTWYLVSMEGILLVGGKPFPCVGASENRKLDAAYKGALTSLFKNGCKWAGVTMWLYKGGKIVDSLDETPTSSDDAPPPAKPAVESRTAVQGHNPETVQHAVDIMDGKVIKGEEALKTEPVKPVSLASKNFEEDEVAQRRVTVLEEFNQALPNPFAEPWVRSNIALFLVRFEEKALTPEMLTKKTPVNYVWNLLLTAHTNQCKPACTHAEPFFEKLKAIK